MEFLLLFPLFLSSVLSIDILYDGSAQSNFGAGVLDNSTGPYLTYVVSPFGGAPTECGFMHSAVKGSETASHVCPSKFRLFASRRAYCWTKPSTLNSSRLFTQRRSGATHAVAEKM